MARESTAMAFDPWRALALLAATGSLLGISAIWAKYASEAGWTSLALLFWSMIGGAALQAVFNGWRRLTDGLTVKAVVFAVGSGGLFAVPSAMAFAAVDHVGAGFVALSYAFPLLFTYVLALPLGMDRVNKLKLLAVGFGVAGAALMAVSKVDVNGALSGWALLALAAPVVLAIGNLYRSRLWPTGAGTAQMAVGMLVFGAATMAMVLPAFGLSFAPMAWGTPAMALLAAQSITFALMYDVYFRLQKLAGPVYLSQIGSVAAVVGVALAFVLFDERPNVAGLVAIGLVASGIVAMSRASRVSAPRSAGLVSRSAR